MPVDFNDLTFGIGLWLEKHDIPIKGVKIDIEFPEERHARAAENAIKGEINRMKLTVDMVKFGTIETMNGIALSFRQKTF